MSSLRKELHLHLVNPEIAGPVCLNVFTVLNAATADATLQLFVASRKCRILRASYVQAANATAVTSFTALLQNKTGTVALTDALDIKALVATTAADWAVIDSDLADGDIVEIVFNETGGTVTAPGLVGITAEIQLLE